jgi:Zn-dependent oligopeptidase
MNPLLEKFNTPYNTVPFSKIKEEHYKPAFKKAIEFAKKEIEEITQNTNKPNFQNTIVALENSGDLLDRISSIFFNLNSAETNDTIQSIAQEISPLLSEFSNDIRLNEILFKKVKIVYEKRKQLNLNAEEQMLLEKQYKGFSRNGANLKGTDRETLREIDKKLSKLSLQFGENLLAETNAFTLHITDIEKLNGLPESVLEAAKQCATQKDKKGWVFTLDYPSYIPFMTYLNNRNLRKEMAIAFGKKSFQNNKHDNQNIVLEIVKLRHQRATLLGYKTHAHFVLEERMAETPENVLSFSKELLQKAKPAAIKEFDKLRALARKDGIEKLEKWDGAYYSEKLKKELFDLEEEAIKPYFKLENVLEGAFTVANKLFGLQFKEVVDIDKYHKDVITYKVTDEHDEYVAIFYADFFPREGKRNGAWMTTYKNQFIKHGQNSRPHISNVCNFTKPTATKPSLLTFNEVTTLFHEFGHGLHGMLANTTYASISGTNVSWDFVELPSQIFENWCYEEAVLKLFAKHYETGEVIPMEFIEKIRKASSFLEGMQTMRQLSFGLLDMSWHSQKDINTDSMNVKIFENESFSDTQLYPDVPENCMSTSFSHIFQGGYSAGYYSYKWAEVLDADAFEYFQEKGIFDKEIGSKFKNTILSQGGTKKPMELYLSFRGKKPNSDALLKRAGLL